MRRRPILAASTADSLRHDLSPAAIATLMTAAVARFGHKGGFVANAGIALHRRPLVGTTPQTAARALAVNLTSTRAGLKVAARYLLAEGRGGSLTAAGPSTALCSLDGRNPGSVAGRHSGRALAARDRSRLEVLRDQFDAGMGRLREALVRRATDGLVTPEEHRVCKAAPLSRCDLQDFSEVRSNIGIIARTQQMQNGDDAGEGQILAALHQPGKRSRLIPWGNINLIRKEAHQRVQQSLVAGCASLPLLSCRQVLAGQARRQRHLSVHYTSTARMMTYLSARQTGRRR